MLENVKKKYCLESGQERCKVLSGYCINPMFTVDPEISRVDLNFQEDPLRKESLRLRKEEPRKSMEVRK